MLDVSNILIFNNLFFFWTLQEICDSIGKNLLTPNFESEFQRFFL